MKKVYENWSCEIFPGFYESLLYNSDTLCHFDSEALPDGYGWEFVKGGWDKFCKETCEKWVDAMRNELENSKYSDKDNPLNLKIEKYCGMWSPREYNFMTDKIQFRVEVNLNKLKKYCWETRREDFDKYLHEHWTSYSGFISFVPNNVNGFIQDYKANYHKDGLIDIMIEWYLLEFIDFEDVELSMCDSEFERLYNKLTLQSEEDWTLWDCEYDRETEKYKPTHKLEVA